MNIKLFNKISKIGLDELNKQGVAYSDTATNYDGVLVRSAALHEEQFPESLLAIARAGAGVNNIPVDRCSEEGIVVFNTPGANANAVKELVVLGLLLSSRDVIGGIEWAKGLKGTEGVAKAVEKGKGAFVGPEISGKAIGIIGLGAIGAMVADAARHLGMEVYGYDPYISVDAAWRLSRHIKKATSLSDIYANCDYITLHLPLMDATKGMINAEAFEAMKKGVRILNFARGGLVDTASLKEALANGTVAKYVVDFPDDDTIDMENCIAIPHLGASTPESEDNCAVMAVHELTDYIRTGNILNSVNLPNVEMPFTGGNRICIIHKNIPNMLGQFSSLMGKDNVNIENLINKSKGSYAYTMIDTLTAVTEKVVEDIKAIEGVIKVRVING